MPQNHGYVSTMSFKIGGSQPSNTLLQLVREIVVDSGMYLPDMFTIHLDDPDCTCIDMPDLEIGKTIEISAQAESDSTKKLLTKGEIVAIEPEFTGGSGMTLVLRGYDKSHRLHRGRHSKAFVNMKDSDIVNQIASAQGLSCDIDASRTVYDQVIQDNRTDMEFVYERARRSGYLAWVEDGKLYFKNPGSLNASVTLTWGKELTDFQARLTSADQVNRAEIRGWDYKQKKVVVGSQDSPAGTATVNRQNHGGQMAARAFGISNITDVAHNYPVVSQSEADSLAQSRLNEHCRSFFQAEGNCWGNSAVRAGRAVKIEGVGTRFSGTYLVTRAVHTYNRYGYTTSFEISGLQSGTLKEILEGPEPNPHYGVVVGLVTNVKDPDGLGRIKVKYPSLNEDINSDWARLAAPMAGAERGFQFLPEVDDEVLVAFEYNDINRPYILGALWNGKDKPPVAASDLVGDSGKIDKRVIKTTSGHIITFDDSAQSPQISIVDKSGQKIVMNSAGGQEKIEVIDKTGKSKILMDASKQSVTIESAMDLTIKASGKIQIDGQLGVSVNTAGGNIDIKSNAQTSLKGTQTSVEGTGMTEVKSSGMVKVNGSMVTLN